MNMERPVRICFVCLANIVRSPLAEHVFLHQAQQAGVAEKYLVGSAGTGSHFRGEPRFTHAACGSPAWFEL